ncbi:phosphatidate cytidylyltransferase [Urinicoccus massiliensis]|uniref:phosphatidate cytidylyltransferase n=1 Tax=Urinicoccus massiliensis TaxID=1723382 RepID=UPI00093023EF|nr:phosphatidate cytidylyltransferase [Urinicoccus massiliensis]
MSNFIKRTITAVIGIIIFALILTQGGYLLKAALFVLSLGMLWEIRNSLKNIEIDLSFPLLALFNMILFLAISVYNNLALGFLSILFILIIVFVLLDKVKLADLGLYSLVVTYIPFSIFQLAHLDHTIWMYWIWILAFGTDTFAYLTGMLFGKHKLIPKLSPKKSIEGALGGILGALVLSWVYFQYVNVNYNLTLVLLTLMASVVSQFGDLFASKIKRITGIKDYGKILPGHGGFLDRFDSSIPVIALISIFVQVMIK